MTTKETQNLCLRMGDPAKEPDFKIMILAMEKLGTKIIQMKNDTVYLEVKVGSPFATEPETRTMIKELLWENWEFKMKWALEGRYRRKSEVRQ